MFNDDMETSIDAFELLFPEADQDDLATLEFEAEFAHLFEDSYSEWEPSFREEEGEDSDEEEGYDEEYAEGAAYDEEFEDDEEYDDELDFFEEEYEDVYEGGIPPHETDLLAIAERFNRDTDGMTEEEIAEYVGEALPAALVPLIGALAPAVIKAASKGISSLVSRGRKSGQPARGGRPQAPPRPQVPPRRGVAATTQSLAIRLLGLIDDPQFRRMIQNLAVGRTAGELVIGAEHLPVSEGAFLNALNQVAIELATVLEPDGSEDMPEYLLDASGHPRVDPTSPEQRAEAFMDILEEHI